MLTNGGVDINKMAPVVEMFSMLEFKYTKAGKEHVTVRCD